MHRRAARSFANRGAGGKRTSKSEVEVDVVLLLEEGAILGHEVGVRFVFLL